MKVKSSTSPLSGIKSSKDPGTLEITGSGLNPADHGWLWRHHQEDEYCYREMSYGSFRRMVPLTARVDADKVKAEFRKGVLKVTLPKVAGAESERGRKIEIKS